MRAASFEPKAQDPTCLQERKIQLFPWATKGGALFPVPWVHEYPTVGRVRRIESGLLSTSKAGIEFGERRLSSGVGSVVGMSSPDETEEEECPLCMEVFDLTDKQFFPCSCSYQVRTACAAPRHRWKRPAYFVNILPCVGIHRLLILPRCLFCYKRTSTV